MDQSGVRHLQAHSSGSRVHMGQQPIQAALEVPLIIVNGTTETIKAVTELFQNGSKLLKAVRAFGTDVVFAVDQALAILAAQHKEKIELDYHGKTALHDLVMITEKAVVHLGKVTDIFWYGKNKDMVADVRRGLRDSPPNLEPLGGLMSQLKRSLKHATESNSAFEVACDKASCSFSAAAQKCAVKKRKCRDRKRTTKIAGGTTSAVAIGTGVVAVGGAGTIATVGTVASIVVGIPTLGIGTVMGLIATASLTAAFGAAVAGTGVAGSVATHFIAKDFAETESSLRRIQEDFNSLLSCAHRIREEVAEIETKMNEASTQMDHISGCMTDGNSTVLLQTAVRRFHEVCSNSYGTAKAVTAQLKDRCEALEVQQNDMS